MVECKVHVYVERRAGVWLALGLNPQGKVSFTSFSPLSRSQALRRALSQLKPWEQPVLQREPNIPARRILKAMENVFLGRGAGWLPAFDWGRLPRFTVEALKAALRIPRGFAAGYGCIAHVLGKPKAARAVGRAMAVNPFPLLVPCHRVVASDGSLGGYGFGLKVKMEILRREGVRFTRVKGKVKVSPESLLKPENF